MKNFLLLFVLFFVVSVFLLQSCKKGENPLKPYETSDHPVVWQYNFEKSNAGSKTFPAMDEKGNIYIGAPGHIQKNTPDGELLWTFDDYDYTTATINVSYAPPLASGDMIYYGGEGLFAVKTSPDMRWIKYPETHFTAPGYPVFNSDGDIIVVGNGYVNCIKGDGQHLLNTA